MENNQPQSILIQNNRWDVLQHLQWKMIFSDSILHQTSTGDIFNLQVLHMYRGTPNETVLIGAIRLLDEGNNTRILFIPYAAGEKKMIMEPLQRFFDAVRDYYHESVISEGDLREPSGLEKVDRAIVKARQALVTAQNEEDFQAIGILCREAVISLAQEVYKPDLHGLNRLKDDKELGKADAKGMIENYLAAELPGDTYEEIRKYAKDCYQLAASLQHNRSANYMDAALCIEATRSLVNTISIIVEQKKSSRTKSH